MRIVVGLGNPGREYVGTRHNIGFEVIDALAAKLAWTSGAAEFDRLARTKFDALAMDGQMTLATGGGTEKLLLLKPTTYMNLSGRTVQQALAFYNLTPRDALIVLDDVALPCGRLRLRPSGTSGGHNGLKDIERALATIDYPRLRIGIDPPPPRVPQKDYVLGRFTDAQREQLDPALTRACSAAITWIERGTQAAMNHFNAEERTEERDQKSEVRNQKPE
jgi:PTH1 family peptidyl-tRNA hydrolase